LEVLRRIPEKDYIKLKEYAFLFEWFIPDYSNPVVLYLSSQQYI
jgi:hypothetical protein